MSENVLTILNNDFTIIVDSLTGIKNKEVSNMTEQLIRQFNIRNGDMLQIYNTLTHLINWFDLSPSYKADYRFTYDTLIKMSELSESELSPITSFAIDSKPNTDNSMTNTNRKILISHSGKDKKYCDALLKFLLDLGIDDNNIIYTSDSAYGVPQGENIYKFLKEQFHESLYVLFVLSDDYFNSAPTLNEMGAAWVSSAEFSAIAVPNFDYNNNKFKNCALDSQSIAGRLDDMIRMQEVKNKLVKFFNLKVDEKKWTVVLRNYSNNIS